MAEIVERLGEAAESRRSPMPPSQVRLEPVTLIPRGEGFAHCESGMLTFPRSYPFSNHTGPILEPQITPESDYLSSQLSDPVPEMEGSGSLRSPISQYSDLIQEVEAPDRQSVLSAQCNDPAPGEPDINGPMKQRPSCPPIKLESLSPSSLDTTSHLQRLQGKCHEGVTVPPS